MGSPAKHLRVSYHALPTHREYVEVAVVIDVLLATTTVLAALEAGTPYVRAIAEIEHALALRSEGMLIAGERRGLRVEGFDFGNSPLEIVDSCRQAVGPRPPLALCSTNGSRTLLSVHAGIIFASCIRNASATAGAVVDHAFDGARVLLQGSGQDGHPTEEDAIAAGAILAALGDRGALADPDDDAHVAREAWERARSCLAEALLATPHGRYLATLGFADDVLYAAALDASKRVIVVQDGVLTFVPCQAPC